jgi:hypothetical protein
MSTLIRAARHAALATAVAVAAGVACADDIDIFATVPTDNDLPNVMILWDNSANWGANIPVAACSYDDGSGSPKPDSPNKEQGTKMAIEKCAILNVIHALPTNPDGSARFNVALMLFNESPSQNSGGYPRMRFLPMSAANKTTLKAAIRGISINGDKGNNAAFTKSLHEAYLMFSKAAPLKGTAGTKWDPLAVAGGQYVGPPGSGCGRNHIIFVANGGAGEVTDNEAMALLSAAGGNVTPLVYPTALITNSDQGNWADEYARFLNGVDIVGAKEGVQSVTTHAIAVTGSSSDGKYPNFMRAIATQGGGQYYSASDITQLTKYLINIFNSIQATNSVFASASLPISASSQGSYKNQVFVGVFRPDEEARPRWVGNLKQYKIGYDRATDTMQLVDAEGSAALNSAHRLLPAFRGQLLDQGQHVLDQRPDRNARVDHRPARRRGRREGRRRAGAADAVRHVAGRPHGPHLRLVLVRHGAQHRGGRALQGREHRDHQGEARRGDRCRARRADRLDPRQRQQLRRKGPGGHDDRAAGRARRRAALAAGGRRLRRRDRHDRVLRQQRRDSCARSTATRPATPRARSCGRSCPRSSSAASRRLRGQHARDPLPVDARVGRPRRRAITSSTARSPCTRSSTTRWRSRRRGCTCRCDAAAASSTRST